MYYNVQLNANENPNGLKRKILRSAFSTPQDLVPIINIYFTTSEQYREPFIPRESQAWEHVIRKFALGFNTETVTRSNLPFCPAVIGRLMGHESGLAHP